MGVSEYQEELIKATKFVDNRGYLNEEILRPRNTALALAFFHPPDDLYYAMSPSGGTWVSDGGGWTSDGTDEMNDNWFGTTTIIMVGGPHDGALLIE